MKGGFEWFKPLRGLPKARQIIGFDIEGVGGPDGFVCGAIVGETIYQFFTNRAEMQRAVIGFASDGFMVLAHNLQYDLPILEGEDFPVGDLLFSRYTLLWATYPKWGKKVRVYDSCNLFPRHSVAAVGRMVGYPKLELPALLRQDLARGRKWESFTPSEKEVIRRYCLRDAEIVFMGVAQLQEVLNRLGGNLRPTIAGCSMDLYRRKYHKWPFPVVGPETNRLIRPGFYGGRTENFYSGLVDGCNLYDITSLYPYVQASIKFPHPAHLRLDIEVGPDRSWMDGEGMVSCTVDVPAWFIPPLPHRFGKRLFFPYGRFSGCWPIYELRQALEMGVGLVSVDWVIGSKVTFNPFREFVADCFGLRRYYLDQNDGMANIVKLILNSLYGRWGLEPEGGLYQLVDLDGVADFGRYAGYTTADYNGRLYGYGPVEAGKPPDYINVFFAAQIAAGARVELLAELTRQGERAVYCDTDSIITTGDIPTGPALGDWRLEMERGQADLIGPKEYALHNAALGDRYVVKGVPADVAEMYLKTGVARFFRAVNVREAMREGQAPATWVETFKSARDVFPKRFIIPSPVGSAASFQQTFPYRVSELPLVCQGYYSQVPELEWSLTPRLPAGLKLSQGRIL